MRRFQVTFYHSKRYIKNWTGNLGPGRRKDHTTEIQPLTLRVSVLLFIFNVEVRFRFKNFYVLIIVLDNTI